MRDLYDDLFDEVWVLMSARKGSIVNAIGGVQHGLVYTSWVNDDKPFPAIIYITDQINALLSENEAFITKRYKEGD